MTFNLVLKYCCLCVVPPKSGSDSFDFVGWMVERGFLFLLSKFPVSVVLLLLLGAYVYKEVCFALFCTSPLLGC